MIIQDILGIYKQNDETEEDFKLRLAVATKKYIAELRDTLRKKWQQDDLTGKWD